MIRHPFSSKNRRWWRVLATSLLMPLLGAACASAGDSGPIDRVAPSPVAATEGFVSSAHPLATEAGLEVLARGGSAIDAAIAVQAMLGLAEPQSSGLAGGAVVLHYDARTRRVDSYIGRERAPASANTRMFSDAEGRPLSYSEAKISGHATGVPGALPALELAHRTHGKLPWSTLFEFTARRAREGFEVTPRLHAHIDGKFLQASQPDVVRLFSGPDGRPLRVGDTYRNPAYAETLSEVAARGAAALQSGPIAEAIVARVNQPPYPAQMTLDDLASNPVEREEALCRPLRAWMLCAPPPPASGVGVLQLMQLLDGTDIAERGPDDPKAWLLFAEASRVMYADRDHYLGDPKFVTVPVDGLLEPGYVDSRRALIGSRVAAQRFEPGRPAGAPGLDADATKEPAGTSHLVVVDSDGNAVSMTTTIESYFGSGRVVGGMLLNNQLTDFSFTSDTKVANSIAPGKRSRSSMAPVIILDEEGRFVGAVGSPGGGAIPAFIGKTLVGALYWGMPLQAAVDLPNVVARGDKINGEARKFPPGLRRQLSELGVEVAPGAGEESGLHGVLLRDGVLEGAADPRREGVARQL